MNVTDISADDVIKKIGTYFEADNEIYRNSDSLVKHKIILLRKLCSCESWVAEQFGVKNFVSLGYGDFLLFLEKYVHLLPHELLNLFADGTRENSSYKACMSSNQLAALVSQAISLSENETVTKQMISVLLTKQFPSIVFQDMENDSLENLLGIVQELKSSVTSKCVLFSATMIENNYHVDSLSDGDNNRSEITTAMSQKTRSCETVTAKNAIEILLKSPMLSDLSKWSHWDLMFAPSLGSLISWLLNDVNTKELLCLVTRDGKVIRIDHSATLDSFLEAAVRGSSFQTAVNLVSITSLFGGVKSVPLSLLKCHARHAFGVMFRNYQEDVEVHDDGKTLLSKFVLDCLDHLPAEFQSFASDVLRFGMQSVFKDAASAILNECSNMEQRLMLHEAGLSLGILEWTADYNTFLSKGFSDDFWSRTSCLKDAVTEVNTGLKHDKDNLDKSSMPEANMVTALGTCEPNERCTEINQTIDREKSSDESIIDCPEDSFQHGEDMEASLVIESIRRDEFGLDPSLSDIESCMLKKQHARLGRALHCLSQELYSQDSHFILELVRIFL